MPAKVFFAGDQMGFAGLDQFNAGPLSPLLSGRSRADILFRINGHASNMPFVDFAGPIAAQRPEIIRVAPDVLRPGESFAEYEIRGRNMGIVTGVEIMPSGGITFVQSMQSDAAINGRLTLSESAAFGPRMLSVLSPNGRSRWHPIEVIDLPADAPVVSNLDLDMVAPPSGLVVNLAVDWRDANRDIRWAGQLTGRAFVDLTLTSDGLTCRYVVSGRPIEGGGQQSGRLIVSGGTGRTDLVARGMSTYEVTLVDVAGNRGNTVTGQVMVRPLCEPDDEPQVFLF